MNVTTMFCYFSVTAGDCVMLKDAAGEVMKIKTLPMNYADFARRVNRRYWQLVYAGPGSFHFVRKI